VGLFSGKPENKPSPISPSHREERTPASIKHSTTELPTVIGKDAVVKGELTSEKDMLIEGRVEGKIRGAHLVVIGESGNVHAHVHARIVTVSGEVHGDCEATKKVEIAATGKVFGNISAETIVVAEGATFRGSSKMTKPVQPKPVEAKAPSAPTPPNETRPPTPSVN
jgi:cytoskeletal protein CcmA (bactofilin family)